MQEHGWQNAELNAGEKLMCQYAEKLTLSPATVGKDDVKTLRDGGWSDREIHDAAQVIAYFNYINRIADGLGVDLEPEFPQPCADD